MPNPRKPTALKVLEGTDRPDRANPAEPHYQPTSGLEPLDWLNGPTAVEVWKELVGLLEGARVLTKGDRIALMTLCNWQADVIDAWRSRTKPTAAEVTQLRLLYQEFGLTPASRSRVSSAGDAAGTNKFAQIGKAG